MIKALFGQVTEGRLKRLPYLGYMLLLAALVVGFALAVVLMIGAGEQLVGGDLQQAQQKLAEWLGLPFMLVFGLFLALLVFASANIMAKRIRDIGLPGWWMVLAIALLEMVLSATVSEQASSSLHLLVTLLLLVIPSDALGRNRA